MNVGKNNTVYWLAMGIVLCLLAQCTAASEYAPGNLPEMVIPAISGNVLNPFLESSNPDYLTFIENLSDALQSQRVKTGPNIMSIGAGWQNITMPAVISEPGLYRIDNNYSAEISEIALSITCSDVIIDGGGHVFVGNDEYPSYGLVALSVDIPLNNISVSNYQTENCRAGIIFDKIQGGEISGTHHKGSTDGIFIRRSDLVILKDNTINGYKIGQEEEVVFGIIGVDISNISIHSNYLSNLTPMLPDFKSKGIFITNGTDSDINLNNISESRMGIVIDSSESIKIAGNTFAGYGEEESSEEMLGIYGMNSRDLLIESNVVSPAEFAHPLMSSSGIILSNCSESAIFGNEISQIRKGVVIDSSRLMNISQNRIEKSNDDKSFLEILGIWGMDSTGVTIDSNSILTSGSLIPFFRTSGISLTACSDIKITNNSVFGEKDFGIVFDSDENERREHLVIDDNRISSSKYGINIRNGQGIISNNSVSAGTYGLNLGMDDTLVIKNHVFDNLQTGLGIMGSNLTLKYNNLANNSYNFYIEGSTLEQYLHQIDRTNLADGKPIVYIKEQSGVTIGPDDDPSTVIAVSCDNISIHNIATGKNAFGILLVHNTNATVEYVSDTGSFGAFASLWSRGISVNDFSASMNKVFGFMLQYSADSNLTGCWVTRSSGNGFVLLSADNVSLTSCVADEFVHNAEQEQMGIRSDLSKSVFIVNSSISGSFQSGLSVVNTDNCYLSSSVIMNNSEHGVICEDSSLLSVKNSIIAGNKESGLFLLNSSVKDINRNFFLGNEGSGMRLIDIHSGIVADNFFNNTQNVDISVGTVNLEWNTTLQKGHNIVKGSNLGGNYWAQPDGQGFSQTHANRGDGICNASYLLTYDNVDYLPLASPSQAIMVNFTADIYSGNPPLTVHFTDTSTGSPETWKWTFGDGTVSYEQNPVHTFSGIGRYSVTLEVTGQDGKQGVLRWPACIDVNSGRILGPNGMVWINSTPVSSSVFIDGLFIGQTPLKASGIRGGVRQLQVTHEGYQNWTGKVRVLSDAYTYVPHVVLKKV